MRVWRISKAKYARVAFTEGARHFDGRWNFAGVPIVYTSLSLSLAAMEFFVHIEPWLATQPLVSSSADIPEDLEVERLTPKN